MLALVLVNLGTTALQHGDHEQARAHLAEGLRLWREVGNPAGVTMGLAGLARLAAAQGQAARAGRLFGAAAARFPAGGRLLDGTDRAAFDRHVGRGPRRPRPGRVRVGLGGGAGPPAGAGRRRGPGGRRAAPGHGLTARRADDRACVAFGVAWWEAAGSMPPRQRLPSPGDELPPAADAAARAQEPTRLVLRSGAAASFVTRRSRHVAVERPGSEGQVRSRVPLLGTVPSGVSRGGAPRAPGRGCLPGGGARPARRAPGAAAGSGPGQGVADPREGRDAAGAQPPAGPSRLRRWLRCLLSRPEVPSAAEPQAYSTSRA